MVANVLRAISLTVLFTCFSTVVKAEIVQEITQGCSESPIVSTLCITFSPFYTTTIIAVVPSEWSGTAWGAKSKIIYQAKSDAATFVASNGAIKGSYLEAAFVLLRQEDIRYSKSDELALAKAILVFNQTATEPTTE